MEKVISGIYKITNCIDEKFYIGSSKDIRTRFQQHKNLLNKNLHYNNHLQHAWNFYGENVFIFEVIEEVENNPDSLFGREQFYLDLYQSYNKNIGYNININSIVTHMD